MTPRLTFSMALFGWALIACASTGQNVPAPQTKDSTQADALLAVDTVAKAPANWAGKKVKVTGNFSGWKGKCTGSPPVSRSDWMMDGNAACMYVSGRLPPELSSIPPAKGIGKPIVVIGKIIIDQRGKAYIQSERVSVRELSEQK
jgi:hypothetical protein